MLHNNMMITLYIKTYVEISNIKNMLDNNSYNIYDIIVNCSHGGDSVVKMTVTVTISLRNDSHAGFVIEI